MTARSGDALSHVYFQARQNAVLTEISAPESCDSTLPPGIAERPGRASPKTENRSCRICMAAMRRHRGTNRANLLHLPITCLNLSPSRDDCIRK
jgi:hypothetical protein